MAKRIKNGGVSNPGLAPAFDPGVFKIMEETDNLFWRIREDVEIFAQNCCVKNEDADEFMHSFVRHAPSMPLCNARGLLWQSIKKKAGLPPTGCEICRLNKALEGAHIGTRCHMKSSRLLKDYMDHPLNVMQLCRTHHGINDQNEIDHTDRAQYRRFFRARRRLTELVRRMALKEWQQMHHLQQTLDEATERFNARAHAELQRFAAELNGQDRAARGNALIGKCDKAISRTTSPAALRAKSPSSVGRSLRVPGSTWQLLILKNRRTEFMAPERAIQAAREWKRLWAVKGSPIEIRIAKYRSSSGGVSASVKWRFV